MTKNFAAAIAAAFLSLPALAGELTFELSLPKGAAIHDGRAYVLLSTDPSKEPREQITFTEKSQIIFGLDVEDLKAGAPVRVTQAKAQGWPYAKFTDLPVGDYQVQAIFNVYDTYRMGDGRVLKLPPDKGEGQKWNKKPGNPYSKPVKLRIDPKTGGVIKLNLDQAEPAIAPKPDTTYVRHIKVHSDLLSKFYGRDVELAAHVLVPLGFDDHPEAKYPLVIFHNHFTSDFGDFRETPPDADLKPDFSDRFQISGYNRIQQEEAYKNYQRWISAKYPRYLVVEVEHPTPFYDDSYAVNSANVGPYGDAINTELLPALEKKFRSLAQGWARFTYGGSTGGWEALATQVFYPDLYNGAFAACPDPVTFEAYTVINLYKDANAYTINGPHKSVERPSFRNTWGDVFSSQRDVNRFELALGIKGRSTEQYDIWQAVYSPIGTDGYPKPIWDKQTGKIDHDVAAYWREHYDLVDFVVRNWKTLGPKWAGKLNLYVGTGDNYFLDGSVRIAEQRFKTLSEPAFGGEIAYGIGFEHCWNGDPTRPNHITRLHYADVFLDRILKRIDVAAPPGADLTSWRY